MVQHACSSSARRSPLVGPINADIFAGSSASAAGSLRRDTHRSFLCRCCRWFSGWCQYSGFVYDPVRKKPKVVPQQEPAPRPGPIDNSDLVAEPPVRTKDAVT